MRPAESPPGKAQDSDSNQHPILQLLCLLTGAQGHGQAHLGCEPSPPMCLSLVAGAAEAAWLVSIEDQDCTTIG